MASKTLMFLLGTLLLVATKVSSYQKEDDEIMSSFPLAPAPAAHAKPPTKAPAPSKAPSPLKAPAPSKAPAAAPPAKPPMHPIIPPIPAPSPVPGHPITKKDCIPLCEQRCKLHSSKRKCVRACTACCDKCKCVPPGTDGHREMCGQCYTETRIHGHIYQCP